MNNSPLAPRAKKSPTILTYHNQEFIDDYYWLRNKDSEAVLEYLNAENEFTKSSMANSKALQETFFQEIKGRMKEDDQSVPVFEDGYWYYSRTETGEQYRIHCRKLQSLYSEEEILLNENLLAEGKDFFSLGEFAVSPNNNLLAYSVDFSGNESYELFIFDLTTKKLLNHTVRNTYYGLEWSNDSEHVFYTKIDDTHRPHQVWLHNITQDSQLDQLKFHEPDESFFLDISKTKDDKYILLNIGSQVTSEVHYLSADTPDKEFTLFAKREHGVEYQVGHLNNKFHILTNAFGAVNFQWMKTDPTSTQKQYWREVIPYNESHYLLELELFDEFFVLEERVDGLTQLRVFSSNLENQHHIVFDEPTYSVSIGDNPEVKSGMLRIHYRSLVTPNTTYDYDLRKKKLITLKVQDIPSGYDKSLYTSERLVITASDGAKIPVSLVYKEELRNSEKPNPMYLYAYGSYGVNVDPYFSISQLSLLDRGFVFAIAHIRGGSDKGRQWYEDGKFLNKKNTFSDFVTVAKYFIDHGYTSSTQLIANGGSAGGLLMGAILNMAPELFQTVIADVPFVDVINTMMDETIPLTVIEYDEWGNPNESAFFEYMRSYSPYDNVQQKDYPHILVTAGLNDPRVQYWEPAKWVAKLRAHKTDDNLLLLKTNMDAGHAGKSGRFERLKETAFEYAFIMKTLAEFD